MTTKITGEEVLHFGFGVEELARQQGGWGVGSTVREWAGAMDVDCLVFLVCGNFSLN